MYFLFSMPRENKDELDFYMVPNGVLVNLFDEGKHQFLAIESDTFKDEKYGDVNGNHLGVDVGSLIQLRKLEENLKFLVEITRSIRCLFAARVPEDNFNIGAEKFALDRALYAARARLEVQEKLFERLHARAVDFMSLERDHGKRKLRYKESLKRKLVDLGF